MARRGHLVVALADRRFRRLLAVRFAAQFGDGIFQASLAGTVLFDPEHQAHASDIAAGFAVLLLPYSLIGPFAGVLIDRWSRQRIATVVNLVRALVVLGVAAEIGAGVAGIPFYASALIVISAGRFILASISAAQPRVVPEPELVTANALAGTAGTLLTALGGGAAVGIRAIIGNSNGDYALIATLAVVPYLLASVVASGFARGDLGPSEAERQARETPREVLRSLAAGARDVRDTPVVARALATIAVHRLGFGVWTVCALLLYRNYFADSGFFRAGLTGLGQLVAVLAAGGALAALITPRAFRRYGPVPWMAGLLVTSAAVEIALGLPYHQAALVSSGLLLGLGGQGIKISVDTLVQQHIDDAFRGRVFALYDVLFNLGLVLASAITALALPESGHSPAAVISIGCVWAVTAAAYLTSSRRTSS